MNNSFLYTHNMKGGNYETYKYYFVYLSNYGRTSLAFGWAFWL